MLTQTMPLVASVQPSSGSHWKKIVPMTATPSAPENCCDGVEHARAGADLVVAQVGQDDVEQRGEDQRRCRARRRTARAPGPSRWSTCRRGRWSARGRACRARSRPGRRAGPCRPNFGPSAAPEAAAPIAMPSASGVIARPVCSGVKPRPSWMNRLTTSMKPVIATKNDAEEDHAGHEPAVAEQRRLDHRVRAAPLADRRSRRRRRGGAHHAGSTRPASRARDPAPAGRSAAPRRRPAAATRGRRAARSRSRGIVGQVARGEVRRRRRRPGR